MRSKLCIGADWRSSFVRTRLLHLKSACINDLETETRSLCSLSSSKRRIYCLKLLFQSGRDGGEREELMTLMMYICQYHLFRPKRCQGSLLRERRWTKAASSGACEIILSGSGWIRLGSLIRPIDSAICLILYNPLHRVHSCKK